MAVRRLRLVGGRVDPAGTRPDFTVERLSGALTAEHMRVGWQWCLEGIATQLDAAAR